MVYDISNISFLVKILVKEAITWITSLIRKSDMSNINRTTSKVIICTHLLLISDHVHKNFKLIFFNAFMINFINHMTMNMVNLKKIFPKLKAER